MGPEHLSDERLDAALRRRPRWTPPPDFARAVVRRIPPGTIGRHAAPPAPDGMLFRPMVAGVFGACLAGVAGVLLSWVLLRLAPDAAIAADAYQMLLTVATAALIEHATTVAWITAAVMIWIAGSVTGRAQEWI